MHELHHDFVCQHFELIVLYQRDDMLTWADDGLAGAGLMHELRLERELAVFTTFRNAPTDELVTRKGKELSGTTLLEEAGEWRIRVAFEDTDFLLVHDVKEVQVLSVLACNEDQMVLIEEGDARDAVDVWVKLVVDQLWPRHLGEADQRQIVVIIQQ